MEMDGPTSLVQKRISDMQYRYKLKKICVSG